MSSKPQLQKLTPDDTITQIVSADKETKALLESIGMNVSKHKDKTLRSVCKQRQWSETEVLQWLKKNRRPTNGEAVDEGKKPDPDYGDNLLEWKKYLARHILASNQELLNEIESDYPRVLKVHGNQYEWLKNMHEHLKHLSDTLYMYYTFESKKFYPLITKLENSSQTILDGTTGELRRCRTIIMEDQKRLQVLMQTLKTKANHFKNPPGACSTLRILNQNLTLLFNQLEYQLKIEREHILPLIKQRLQDL